MNIYAIDVVVYATAYIRAASEEDAQEIANSLDHQVIDNLPEGTYGEVSICGSPFDNDDLPDVSLSPAITLAGPCEDAKVELVED